MKKSYLAGIIALALLGHMAAGWFLPLTYSSYQPSTGPDKFWPTHAAAHASALAPLIPVQLPGPFDGWAGPGPKVIIMQAPGIAACRMELAFRDIHDSAPPIVKILAGERQVAEFRPPKGKGTFAGEETQSPALFTHRVYIPAKALAASGGAVSITLADGSWVAFDTIAFRAYPPWPEAALAIFVLALAIYFHRRQSQREEAAMAFIEDVYTSKDSLWGAAGIVSLIAAIALPGAHFGLFDGLPLASLAETLALMVVIPTLMILGAGFFRWQKALMAVAALLVLKCALFLWAPAGGMAMRVFDTPSEQQAGDWRRTYDTLLHPGMSALITSPITQGSQLPVDWLWRRDERFWSWPFKHIPRQEFQGGSWIGANLEAWARIPEGRKMAFLTLGLGPQAIITAQSPDGREITIHPSPAADGPPKGDDRLIPSGIYNISASLAFSQEWDKNYLLVPVLVRQDGAMDDAFSAGAIWKDGKSATTSSGGITFARVMARLFDAGIIALLVFWTIWALGRRLREKQLDPALLAASVAAVIMAFWLDGIDLAGGSFLAVGLLPAGLALVLALLGRALAMETNGPERVIHGAALAGGLIGLAIWPLITGDCGEGGWTSLGIISIFWGVFFIRWAGARPVLADEAGKFELALFVLTGPMLFAWFIWKWRWMLGVVDLYPDLSDQLSMQVFSREAFVEGDFWQKAAEPIYYSQPGHRYLVGALHVIFGQSSLAQNIVEIWSMLVTAAAMITLGRWARLPARAMVTAPFIFLFLMGGPFFIWLVGLGRQELAANLFQFASLALAAHSQGGAGLMALSAMVAIPGITFRIDRFSGIAAAALMAARPMTGGLTEAWRNGLSAALPKWRSMALYLGLLVAALLAVMTRNLITGGVFTLVGSAASTPPCFTLPDILFAHRGAVYDSFWRQAGCVYGNYEQILAGSNKCFDRAGIVMISGVVISVLALLFRPRWLRLVPLQMGLILLALLAPYSIAMITLEPRFSLHVLPLASIALVMAAHSILRHLSARGNGAGGKA